MDVGELQAFVAESRRRDLKLLDIISRQEWKESGYRHLWQFLMDVMRVPASEAKRLQHHVELLCPKVGISGQVIEPKLPAVRAAMAEGAISGEHVHRIDKVLGKVPEQAVEQVERELVELAYQFNPTQVAKLGLHIINTLDPDGPEPADATVTEGQNELDLREHEDGSLSGRFHLGAESAALVKSMLSPLTTPRTGDDRTLIERQGDALAEIIGFAADSGKAPMEGGERPAHRGHRFPGDAAVGDRGRHPGRWPQPSPRSRRGGWLAMQESSRSCWGASPSRSTSANRNAWPASGNGKRWLFATRDAPHRDVREHRTNVMPITCQCH